MRTPGLARLGTISLVVTALIGLAAGNARAANYNGLMIIYDDGRIAGADAQTGALTPLGQTSQHPWQYIHASAFDPTLDRIYIAWTDGGMVGDLYTLNADTYAVEKKVSLSYARAGDMEYDTIRNRLLVCSEYQEFLIWQVDPTTGGWVRTITRLPAGLASNQAMAYVPSEDALYVFRQWGDQDSLVRYSLPSGQLSTVREGAYWNQTGFGEMNSLCYNPANDSVFCMDAVSHKLGRIDRLTGTVALVGPAGGYPGASSIIYVPEPATLALLALGGLVALRRRR